MELSNKIVRLRRRYGLSQEELANRIGVSRQAVFKWESGSNMPDMDKIKKIVKLFNVSFDFLLDDNIEFEDLKQIPLNRE